MRWSRPAAPQWLPALELAAVAAVFVADWNHLIFLSKTPYLLAIAALSLWARRARWRDLGWRVPPHWLRLVLIGLAAGVAMEAMELFATQPLIERVTGRPPDLSDVLVFASSWQLFLLAIALSWTLAALGEETVWRGYVLDLFGRLLGPSRPAAVAALVLMSAAFGLAHADQGITGVAENAWNGLLLGGLFLATGRNLIAPVVAHGVTDTIDFSLIYAGLYPGL